jgi:GT2 family glycosyltransferase
MTIAAVRNRVAKYLLDESEAEWLLFIDSDMGFEPDLADRLLEAADPATRPVVGALCFGMQRKEADGRGGWRTVPFPTIYNWRADSDGTAGFRIRWDYPDNTLIPVDATGAASLLVHRDVLAKLRAGGGDTWFDRGANDTGDLLGEDMSFCARVRREGIPIHVHTGVKTTHQRTVWLGEDAYLDARALHALRAAAAEQAPA